MCLKGTSLQKVVIVLWITLFPTGKYIYVGWGSSLPPPEVPTEGTSSGKSSDSKMSLLKVKEEVNFYVIPVWEDWNNISSRG